MGRPLMCEVCSCPVTSVSRCTGSLITPDTTYSPISHRLIVLSYAFAGCLLLLITRIMYFSTTFPLFINLTNDSRQFKIALDLSSVRHNFSLFTIRILLHAVVLGHIINSYFILCIHTTINTHMVVS